MSAACAVRLRPARWWDRWFVLALRNRPDVIAAGIDATSAGAGWWRAVKPWLSIIVADRHRVGYLIVTSIGEVSIVLHPTDRHVGLGTEALRLATREHPFLKARVKPDNAASLAAFRKAGFREVQRGDRTVLLVAP